MPTRYTKGNELEQFQYEIANEIKRDAPHIAQGVFGNNARHPDMATVSNAELDQLYRTAYERNDREWLAQEAQRDPQQFLDVTDRIGVPDPPVDMQGKPVGPPPGSPEAMLQNAAVSPPGAGAGPVAPQAPTPVPAALPPPVMTTPIAPIPNPAPTMIPPPVAAPPQIVT